MADESAVEDDDGEKVKSSTPSLEGEPERETPCGSGADLEHGTPDSDKTTEEGKTMEEPNEEATTHKVVEVQTEAVAEDTPSRSHTPLHSDTPLAGFEISHLHGLDLNSAATSQELCGHSLAVSRESLLGMLTEEVQQSLFTNGLAVGAVRSGIST